MNWSELLGTAMRDCDEDAEAYLRGEPTLFPPGAMKASKPEDVEAAGD